jgi:DDE superfamily endonuclease
MEDTLSVYERPYDLRRPLICMDEASKELHTDVRPAEPMAAGHPRREDAEYGRQGTASIFLYCEPLTGWCHVQARERRTRVDWAHTIRELLDEHYPAAERVVLVMDNLNTHTRGSLYEAFPPAEAKRLADRLELHYTPKHGSWLNIAEIELSVLGRQCLHRRIPNTATLAGELAAWETAHNDRRVPVRWHFTTGDARTKLAKLYPTIPV